ncbi:MAG: protease inhibitor I42 family protein [Methanomicrobiales archaeon]|nr:protease inhibitor I42 family protein [Methanomicrobiales archaeon]
MIKVSLLFMGFLILIGTCSGVIPSNPGYSTMGDPKFGGVSPTLVPDSLVMGTGVWRDSSVSFRRVATWSMAHPFMGESSDIGWDQRAWQYCGDEPGQDIEEARTRGDEKSSISIEGVTEAEVLPPVLPDNSTLTMRLGDQDVILVALEENPSNGYFWNATVSEGLAIVNTTLIENPADAGGKGAGGLRVWSIRPLRVGNETFHAVYAREWEPTGGGLTYTLYVEVTGMRFSERENGETVRVTLGSQELIIVDLVENPSTGYSWGTFITQGLEVVNNSYLQDVGTEGLSGADGVREWTLKALILGNQSFSAVYRRPWDHQGVGASRYSLYILVE